MRESARTPFLEELPVKGLKPIYKGVRNDLVAKGIVVPLRKLGIAAVALKKPDMAAVALRKLGVATVTLRKLVIAAVGDQDAPL